MGRIHSEPDKGLAILAGTLQDALRMHAAQRMYFFFWYLFSYKALTDRLRDAHGMELTDSEGLSIKATHQIAYGLRSDNPGYYDFVVSDPDIIKQPSTACGATDAAHYCNLGITPAFMRKIEPVANTSTDAVAFQLFSMLETAAGATRQLPRRINIGPDRIVDVAHGRMATAMLDGSPPIARGNYLAYLETCEREMTHFTRQVEVGRVLGAHAGQEQKRRRVRRMQHLTDQRETVAISPLEVVDEQNHRVASRQARK